MTLVVIPAAEQGLLFQLWPLVSLFFGQKFTDEYIIVESHITLKSHSIIIFAADKDIDMKYEIPYFVSFLFLNKCSFFSVTIESVGALSPDVLFTEAVKILKKKCTTILSELNQVTN